jgi:hypothetical protein
MVGIRRLPLQIMLTRPNVWQPGAVISHDRSLYTMNCVDITKHPGFHCFWSLSNYNLVMGRKTDLQVLIV